MKSSTIRRSTLSRESMEVIENLAKEQEQDGSLGEYVRPDDVQAKNESSGVKSQEIDLLWQTFKSTQFNTNSPTAYILLGFIIGVITTLVIGGFIIMNPKTNLNINKLQQNDVQEQTLEEQAEGGVVANVVAPDETENLSSNEQIGDTEQNQAQVATSIDTSNMKKYIVKSGDTVEGIIIKHYGSYSPEKAEMIMKANNMESLDRLQIDQELLIPAP